MDVTKQDIQAALDWFKEVLEFIKDVEFEHEPHQDHPATIRHVLENALKDTTQIKMIGKVPDNG